MDIVDFTIIHISKSIGSQNLEVSAKFENAYLQITGARGDLYNKWDTVEILMIKILTDQNVKVIIIIFLK